MSYLKNKVLYVQTQVTPTQKSGIGRYLDGLINEWNKIETLKVQPLNNWNLSYIENYALKKLFDYLQNWFHQKFGKIQKVIFIPNLYPVFKSKHKVFITIHDLAEYDTKTYSFLRKQYRKWLIHRACKYATGIIVVSDFTRSRLLYHMKVDKAKVYLIRPGVDSLLNLRSTIMIDKSLYNHGQYFLYVGRLSTNKNFDDIIKAYKIKKLDLLPMLVISPECKDYRRMKKKVADMDLDDKIKFVGYVSNELLISYYLNANAVVHTSYYEGFGFPVYEALLFNKPVIAADAHALKELNLECLQFYQSGDFEQLFRYLIQHSSKIDSEGLRNEHNSLTYLPTWKQCSRELIELFFNERVNPNSD
jgi:glycosyltransferase involved in cell wall biosynthesis